MMHAHVPVGEEVLNLVGSFQLVDVTALNAVKLWLSGFIIAIEAEARSDGSNFHETPSDHILDIHHTLDVAACEENLPK